MTTRTSTSEPLISGRYKLIAPIGSGGMGTVYRAADRLTGEVLALKRVTISGEHLEFASRSLHGDKAGNRLALAHEFKTLASLRHPYIISVLDYGFDHRRQPFFTMRLLRGAKTITTAGQKKSLPIQVNYLIQTLQALAYLHRRGILHRDLKPGNVLIANRQAHVLDFGLSVQREEARGRAGTVAYMAPEVLSKGLVTEASDLYTFGVLAYELLAGHHPFETHSSQLLADILKRPPDLSPLPASLQPIIGKLLAKNPADRYPDTQAVIEALCDALSQPAPEESPAIRESFLQAARFVGREAELAQLDDALEQALSGQGSAWLVGGESGIGKSRLLDELRIQALVAGALTLRGQAIEGSSAPYSLWRDALQRLALMTPLSDLEAGILESIVPELAALIERDIPDAPTLESKTAHQRLVLTIVDVLRRAAHAQPIVLLLEDLHWCDESLEPLKALSRVVDGLPMLILGSYRNDERPSLPDQLPVMSLLPLQRLRSEHIAELSAWMLGKSGAQPGVVGLLERETEGNVFFLIETVRALAEEAGRLDEVGRVTLPEVVFANGIRRVVQRRLDRLPEADRPLLRLAAVAGRTLDLRVLLAAAPQANLDDWLTTCANLAVLEAQEGIWRFTHDKLREATLAGLSRVERPALHRRVAEALETLYPGDETYAAAWTAHWGVAGSVEKEGRYARMAGEHAASRYANDLAVRFLTRALELTPKSDPATRYAILLSREKVYELQGQRQAQADDIAALSQLAEAMDAARLRAETALRRARYAEITGEYAASTTAAQSAINLAQAAGDTCLEALGYQQWGQSLWRAGDHGGRALASDKRWRRPAAPRCPACRPRACARWAISRPRKAITRRRGDITTSPCAFAKPLATGGEKPALPTTWALWPITRTTLPSLRWMAPRPCNCTAPSATARERAWRCSISPMFWLCKVSMIRPRPTWSRLCASAASWASEKTRPVCCLVSAGCARIEAIMLEPGPTLNKG